MTATKFLVQEYIHFIDRTRCAGAGLEYIMVAPCRPGKQLRRIHVWALFQRLQKGDGVINTQEVGQVEISL